MTDVTPSTPPPAPARVNWVVWAPLGLMFALGLLFIWGLTHGDNRLIQSQWIDKPVPTFDLPPAVDGMPGLSTASMRDGKPRIVNIFASWCVPCRIEGPVLEELKRRGVIIEGIAIRDRPQDLAVFLSEVGNPYRSIGADTQSRVQIMFGSSGVPESFIVDGNGIIRRQIQGVIEPEMVPEILAQLEGAKQ